MIAEQLRNHSFAVIFRRVQLVIRDSFPPEILKQIPPQQTRQRQRQRIAESSVENGEMPSTEKQRSVRIHEKWNFKNILFQNWKKKTEKEPSENVGQSRQESRWLWKESRGSHNVVPFPAEWKKPPRIPKRSSKDPERVSGSLNPTKPNQSQN